MIASNFHTAVSRVFAHEGGYGDHPSDPGGPTNFGITLATYRRHINWAGTADDVRRLKIADARKVYRGEYWATIRADELPAGVDYALFDYAVNSGVGRAGKVIRRVVGIEASTSVVTGDVLAAVDRRDPKALVKAICDERLAFLKSLKTWPTFGRGWERRVLDVRALALAMAGEPQAAPVIEPAPGKGEVAKAPTGTAANAGAAATAGGSLWGWLQAPEVVAALVIGGIVVTLVAVVVLHRLRKARQETPMPVAAVEAWR